MSDRTPSRTRRFVIVCLAALLAATPAFADPVSAVVAVATFVGEALAGAAPEIGSFLLNTAIAVGFCNVIRPYSYRQDDPE